MEFPNEHIIEDIYNTGMVADVICSEEYNKLRRKYNELYDSIESEELKKKFSELEEIPIQNWLGNGYKNYY